MQDLRTYLRLPETERLYSDGIRLFEKYAMEAHSKHFSKLSTGPFATNREVLFRCLQQALKTGVTPIKRPPTIKVHAAPAPANMAPTNETELELVLAIRRLRQKRMQTSQQFHTCDRSPAGDLDRAAICDMLDSVTEKIRKKEQDLAYVKRFGKLPPKEEAIAFGPLPDTEEEIKPEINRMSSHILKVEKMIVHLLTLPENNRKRKKLPHQQLKLSALVSRRSELRIQLKVIQATDG